MIGVIIVTHGNLGQEVLRCAESIVGKQPFVTVLGLEPTEGPGQFEQKIREAMTAMNTPAGILILADMMGGTPCNTALRQCRGTPVKFELVTGVNLPMLVSVLSKRHYMPLEDLAQKVVDDGPRTILRPIQKLKQSMRQEPR